MRTFDPSLILLLLLAALAAVWSSPADAQALRPERPAAAVVEAAPLPAPAPEAVAFASEETGLRVQFPSGWSGTQSIDETTLPARATYRWETAAPAYPGIVVVIERVVGLNPLMEERWRRGQVASGYYGLTPRAPLAEDELLFGPGVGLEIAAGERVGRVYFVQRGQVFWAVHIAAPVGAVAEAPRLLGALARGVRLSDKTVTVAQAAR